jgi:hypothetical protein
MAVSGVAKAMPIAPLPEAATTDISNIIPAYYYRGYHYRYRWHRQYYRHRYYRHGRYYYR